MRPIEGWAVRDKLGVIYYVFGTKHPRETLWVLPKFVPSDEGDRIFRGRGYKKLGSYREAIDWSLRNLSENVRPFNRRGLMVSLPWSSLIEIYSPRRRLIEIIEKGAVYRIEEAAASLAMALSSISGVPIDLFGVSGSILVGLLGRGSDINIVCYPRPGETERIYYAAARLRSMGVTAPVPDERLRAEYRRYGEAYRMSWNIYRSVEERKLLRGIYHGFTYTVKIVRQPFEEPDGRWVRGRIEGMVMDDSLRYLYPSEYKVASLSGLYRVLSYNDIFCEHAMRNERVVVEGWELKDGYERLIVLDHQYGHITFKAGRT